MTAFLPIFPLILFFLFTVFHSVLATFLLISSIRFSPTIPPNFNQFLRLIFLLDLSFDLLFTHFFYPFLAIFLITFPTHLLPMVLFFFYCFSPVAKQLKFKFRPVGKFELPIEKFEMSANSRKILASH